ncbi:uncharacterized protein LOC110184080 [Drosophila serrata]|uniref:uncharacterized protein LOC110184080 n=1 Tax=Drosophila serrata TaxID=7274 RepID=UPI000A1D35F4|nr:uncharacterized protein LOC110184080 [Drosophila serrata]XP_020808124.1 uncharacterized protein LOC110184080 [Drosophila serrata]
MPANIVTTEQVAHQRSFIDSMSKVSRSWWTRFAWYPRMQECHYRRIDQIYLESRQMYGDEHFLLYATRRRLDKKFTQTAANAEERLERQQTMEIDGSVNVTVPKTTNGMYGLLKPTSLHFC